MKALIIVDVQNDFLPGGALAVPDGDRVLEPLMREAREGGYDQIFCSRDWHPRDHCSFKDQGGRWPAHCIANTDGALVHQTLFDVCNQAARPARLINKATASYGDAYSAFEGTGLAQALRERNVTEVVVGGLATDYCVKATVLDALARGFETTVLTDAIAAVDPDDGEVALDAMIDAGAALATSFELERSVWE